MDTFGFYGKMEGLTTPHKRGKWPRVCTEQTRPAEHLGKWRFLAQSTLTSLNGSPILPLLYFNT